MELMELLNQRHVFFNTQTTCKLSFEQNDTVCNMKLTAQLFPYETFENCTPHRLKHQQQTGNNLFSFDASKLSENVFYATFFLKKKLFI